MVKIILALIILVNGYFAFKLIQDLFNHKNEFMKEPGNNIFLTISSAIIFFLSTFGISDFALSTVLYRKRKLVADKTLPGTLNTQCVIPVAVMSLAYISTIKVQPLTLIVCILAQVLGAYIGPRFVVKMDASIIKKFISLGLLIAAMFILAGKFNLVPSGGSELGLHGIKLAVAAISLFMYGALNNLGIGSFSLTMATVYALGLNPAVAFPIMMGACTFSVPIGSVQFIKFGEYGRKITFFTSIFGVLGVLCAVYIVKSLNVSMLQWIVAIILIYSSISMILEGKKRLKTA